MDLAGIQAGLHQAADGNWTMKIVGAHQSKCNFAYVLEIQHHRGSEEVEMRQSEAHQFHDPKEGCGADANLPLTQMRAGKATRRQQGQPDNQRRRCIQGAQMQTCSPGAAR